MKRILSVILIVLFSQLQIVGIANAGALEQSDLKVIVNSGDVQGGVGSLGDILSPKGGTAIGGMIEALNQTIEDLIKRIEELENK